MDEREKLNCPDDLVVTRYLDGDLSSEDRAGVEAHLSDCQACSERVAVLRSIDELVVGPSHEEPLPASLMERVLSAPDSAPTHRRGVIPFLVAACAAAALLLLFVRSPEDLEPAPETGATPSLRSRVVVALVTPTTEGDLWLEDLGDTARVPLQRIALADAPDPARGAILRLSMLGRREAVPTLLRALDRPDRRAAAIEALADLGEPRATPHIAEYLDEETWRGQAVDALVSIGGADASRVLLDAIERSEDEAVVRELVAALATVDGRQGTAALLALLGRPGLRETVLEAFADNADASTPHLAELARGRDDRAAALALEVLERVATPAAVGTARTLLSDYDRRIAAIRILIRIGTREAAAALLSRPLDAEMRIELETARPALLAEFIGSAERGSPAIRARAVDLLANIGTEDAVKALTELAARNRNLKSRIRRALRDRDLEADFTAVAAEPPRTGRRASGID